MDRNTPRTRSRDNDDMDARGEAPPRDVRGQAPPPTASPSSTPGFDADDPPALTAVLEAHQDDRPEPETTRATEAEGDSRRQP